MDDAMHLADTELADRITAEPGFVDYQAIDTGDGTNTSVTITARGVRPRSARMRHGAAGSRSCT
jgi:hypothetical protein